MKSHKSFSQSNNPTAGFSLVEAALIIVILGVASFIGWTVVDKRSQKDQLSKDAESNSAITVGPYQLWLDANSGDDFRHFYKLGLLADKKQNITPGVDSYQLIVLEAAIEKADAKELVVKINSRYENWSYEKDCESQLIPCQPSSNIETNIDIPALVFSGGNDSSELLVKIDGAQHSYKINKKDYILNITDQSGKSVSNSVPYYPKNVGTAVAVRSASNSACEGYSSEQIKVRLKNNSVSLAQEKYPGIEKVRPSVVLVAVNNPKIGSVLVPADQSGCEIQLILPNLKQVDN